MEVEKLAGLVAMVTSILHMYPPASSDGSEQKCKAYL